MLASANKSLITKTNHLNNLHHKSSRCILPVSILLAH